MKQHSYKVQLEWTGNNGQGTSDYRAYRRDYTVSAAGKPELAGSSDPLFRGDPLRYNPEDLLVASLSACHMLSYLHLCSSAGITVEKYRDAPTGTMSLGMTARASLPRWCYGRKLKFPAGIRLSPAACMKRRTGCVSSRGR